MQGQDDLRFRLDWPVGEDSHAPLDTELEHADLTDPLTDPLADFEQPAPDLAVATVGEQLDPADIRDPFPSNDVLERKIDDNTDAVRQLSDAMYELASNVRLLVDEIEALGGTIPTQAPAPPAPSAPDVSASAALVTATAELSAAMERLGGEVQLMRNDVVDLQDEFAIQSKGSDRGGSDRVMVELDRLRTEIQALKRRLPVRARDTDEADIAARVADIVLTALVDDGLLARTTAAAPEEPKPARAAPAAAPKRRPRPLRPTT